MSYTVKNPTNASKAVKVKGAHLVVGPDSEETVDATWTDEQIASYKQAGLIIAKGTKSKAA